MARHKVKTRKSIAKRIKITGSGKVLHVKGARSHKRSIKAKRTLRLLHDLHEFTPALGRRVRRLAPYKKH
jgi:large subunit ribosomal protein L35